jgi:DNA-directed RNA polymerase subunit RPC12/RpoP
MTYYVCADCDRRFIGAGRGTCAHCGGRLLARTSIGG